MRPSTVPELVTVRPGRSRTLGDGWEKSYYTYRDFAGFMTQLTPRIPWRADEYGRIAAECFEDQARLNVVYMEVSFDLPVQSVGDDARFWPITESMEEERRRAESRWPIRITFIAGLMRTMPVEVAVYRVGLASQARDRGIQIVGIDLHGDERGGTAAQFLPAYELARDRGLELRAHAGEAAGPVSVREAIDVLGVRRIGHGVRAIEDPRLMERLKEGDVTLDMCPTSNVRTAVVPSIAQHPIRELHDIGIPVTVSSDDPLPFFTTVEREQRLLVEELNFTANDLRQLNVNAAKAAFLPEAERERLIALIDGGYSTYWRGISARREADPM
jgi:adenosine deaminase